MKIALLGYGRMGKEIEKVLLERGHQVSAKVDENLTQDAFNEKVKGADAAIEFTLPQFAVQNIEKCFHAQLPVVVGTTGWYDAFESVKKSCNALNGTLFYATNFSVGVNVLFHINEILAKVLDNYPEFQPHIEEIHHIHKKDSPSGTAISLAEGLLKNHKLYKEWEEVDDLKNVSEKLPIKAIREEERHGYHKVSYESSIDEISISHNAKSRKGFALGSVLAAEFVKDKKGIYNMKNLLKLA